MRLVMLIILALNVIACSTVQHRWEWDIDSSNKAKVDQATADDQACKDFAYRSKVAGSKFTELDIHISCMQRKGYSLKKVEVANGR